MQRKPLDKLDLGLYTEVLPNGLSIYVIPKVSGNNVYVTCTTKYGSSVNTFIPASSKKMITVPDGIAHFLEHKVFEDKNGVDPFSFFGSRGADSNASTSTDKTTYMFSGSNAFEDNINFLLDFVQEIHLTEENIEKEKGIIKEELLMYEDNPYSKLYEKSIYNSFVQHPIRYPLGGTVESIMEINKEMLLQCYQTFYHPSNMFVVVTGNVDPLKTIEIIRKNQEKKEYKKMSSIQIKQYEEPDEVGQEKESLSKDVIIPKIAVNFKINVSRLSKYTPFQVRSALFHFFNIKFTGTSAFVEALKQEGLIHEDFGINMVRTDTHYLFMILGESKNPDILIQKILEEMKNIHIEETELERKKKVLISSYIYMSDNVYSLNNKVMSNIINYGEVIDDYKEVKSLTYNIFQSIIKQVDFSNKSEVIIDA